MYLPSFEEFSRLARRGSVVPVYREILADLETPLSAFIKIDDGSPAYLLESVQGGEVWGRFSFLARRPSVIIRGNLKSVDVISPAARRPNRRVDLKEKGDLLGVLQGEMSAFRPVPLPGLPRFSGGAVGYLSYDAVRAFERIRTAPPKEGIPLPELFFMISETLLIFDHLTQKIRILSNADVGRRPLRRAYNEAVEKIEQLAKDLERPLPSTLSPTGHWAARRRPVSSLPRRKFLAGVEVAKEYIRAGDVFQVVFSQRFSAEVAAPPLNVYRALRVINPSPYMYFLRMDEDLHLVGSSPEVLVRLEGRQAEVRPIAGTHPRGRDSREDRRLEEELRADPKERAEHLMLVDLGRNDLGRVCVPGSVEVTELMAVERYSHVMHLVSHVRGRLSPGRDAYDVLRAAFPAGTVTGAPKVRAMEIIDTLEPVRRGPYAGAVGYFSFSGNMDTCINIRSILMTQGRAYVQAGAGIVADSLPAREYAETVNKARGMLRAIEMAERGLK